MFKQTKKKQRRNTVDAFKNKIKIYIKSSNTMDDWQIKNSADSWQPTLNATQTSNIFPWLPATK